VSGVTVSAQKVFGANGSRPAEHFWNVFGGNTLVLKQVELLLAEGRAVGNKELSEYLEVRGYATAADWVYGHGIQPGEWSEGQLLSLAEVRHVHSLAMTPVWDVAPNSRATDREGPGSFREHDIEPFPGGMQPTSWTDVPALMRDWITDVQGLRGVDEATIAESLAALHARFEQIHPFLDGNGRTGRLVLNLLLVRLGIPPAIIYKGDRSRYLAALRRADGGDPGPLGGSSHAQCSTTCTSSSSPPSPVPPGWFRSQRSRPSSSPRTPFAWRLSEVASRRPKRRTAHGEARGRGSTSTAPPATNARDRGRPSVSVVAQCGRERRRIMEHSHASCTNGGPSDHCGAASRSGTIGR